MNAIGPPLPALTARIAAAPAELRLRGSVVTRAFVNDALEDLGMAALTEREWDEMGEESRAPLLQLLAFVAGAPVLAACQPERAALIEALVGIPFRLTPLWTSLDKALADPDRREELARSLLASLGMRPAGESKEKAKDRLRTLSSAERQRLLAEARAAQERAARIREELRRKAAEEAADKWGRE